MSESQDMIRDAELCRLCTNVADQTSAEKLFERNQRKLLRQIEELIGQRLKNAKDLPQHICKPCEEQTQQAHAFRAQCIGAQQHFAMQNKKTQKSQQHKNALTEKWSPIEEVVLSELNPVKEEIDYKREALTPPLRVLEVQLKRELMNSDDDFDADDSKDNFNPLDEDCHMTDEDDKMTIEPEISFFADAEYFPNKKIKLKSEKKEKQKTSERTKQKRPKKDSTQERNFICDQCGINTISRSALEIHLRRHTGERPFKCEICPESFILNSDLKVHILKHTDVLPYPCSICDRRFAYKSNANKHEKKHNNERPHVCPQCGKGFTVPDTLKAHMVVHTGERAFGCKMCNMAFKRKTHLITHYRSMTHKQNDEKHQMDTNQSCKPVLNKLIFEPEHPAFRPDRTEP